MLKLNHKPKFVIVTTPGQERFMEMAKEALRIREGWREVIWPKGHCPAPPFRSPQKHHPMKRK